ncbi:MAG: hypothetical protein AAGM22_15145 [Acidobacteriota bacterium]
MKWRRPGPFEWTLIAVVASGLAWLAVVAWGLKAELALALLMLAAATGVMVWPFLEKRSAAPRRGPGAGGFAEDGPDADGFDPAEYDMTPERVPTVEEELRDLAGVSKAKTPLGVYVALGLLTLVLGVVVAVRLGFDVAGATGLPALIEAVPRGLLEVLGILGIFGIQAARVLVSSEQREKAEALKGLRIEAEVQDELRVLQGDAYREPGTPSVAEAAEEVERLRARRRMLGNFADEAEDFID